MRTMRALVLAGLVSMGCNGAKYQPLDDGEDDDSGSAGTGDDATEDADGDGFAAISGDCDDDDPDVNPDAEERCDGIDNDCDGVIDENDAADSTTWYFDGDGDGYGDDESFTQACDQLTNHVAEAGDCNDNDAQVNPGADEVCDDKDNDCNGETDEGDIATAPTWYVDGDGDGYGVEGDTVSGCDEPSGYANNPDDCDDSDPAVNPAASDTILDGIDDDCDGTADQDATCNAYRPFGNTGGVRTYQTFALDGNNYAETVVIRQWDVAAQTAVIERQFGSSLTVQETHRCASGAVEMTGWTYQDTTGLGATFAFSSARTDIESEANLTAGLSWSYSYTATDSTSGGSWDASGTMDVVGMESVTVTAGTFDALKIENTYSFIDSSGNFGSRNGVVEYWYVEGLGVVKTLDTTGSTTNESRELTSYSGFYP